MTRLHPLSVPYRAARTVSRLAWLLVFASVGSASAGLDAAFVAAVVAGGLALALVYQLLYYRRFEYDLAEGTLVLRSGVVSRRSREIPYRRIQNVDISRDAVGRLLGVAAVEIETAGGGQTEAALRYVGREEARRLQEELGRRKRRAAGDAESVEAEAEPERTSLFAIAPRELALLGATSLDLRFVSVLFVAVSVLAPSLAARLAPEPGALLVAAPLALVGLYLVAAVVSGVVSLTNYYGFRLDRVGDELRYQRGLVQQFSGTIPLDKIQTLTVRANALARTLGYASLVVETAGYAPGDDDRAAAVPIARRERVLSLARSVEPFGELAFERPPTRARTRYAVRYALALGAVTAVAFAVDRFAPFDLAWYLLLGALPLVPLAAHVQWSHRGYVLCDDHVVTREGFWVESVRVVPYYRVQTVVTSQTVFQRRRSLATLVVDTAGSRGITGGSPRAVDLDAAVADELREAVADRLQTALDERRPAGRRRPTSAVDAGTPGDGGVPSGS